MDIILDEKPTKTKWKIKGYFPSYEYQSEQTTIQIDERPSWLHCIAYGTQHVLAMFSGVIILPLILGYDSNTCLFFSGICTILFILITGGRVPSYLGCSGSFVSAVLSVTGYKPGSAEHNDKIAPVQGALFILSLAYILVSLIVMKFGYAWLEFIMPPIVTGAIIASIGLHLCFMAYTQITTSPFDSYMAISTILAIILISVYAPWSSLKRISLLLGTMVGYFIHAMCGLKDPTKAIDFSGIVSSPWIRAPKFYTHLEFDSVAIGMVMPLLVILLAENLGHMKAIGSITERPMMKYIGRAYLGDAIGCLVASLGGTIPFTTYAENIGVLSVTKVYSSLVLLFAAMFAVLLGFFAKFNAIIRSIPNGVIGGVSFILYTFIAVTGIRIWVVYQVDFNDTRNMFIGGLPVLVAVVLQTPIKLNNFELDGIGAATFGSILLYQLLYLNEHIKKKYKTDSIA